MNSVSNHFFNFFVDMLLRPLKTNLKYGKKKILSSRTYCLSFFLYSSFSSFITFSCTLFFSHNFLYLSHTHTLSLSLCMTARKIFIRNRKAMVLGASGNAPSLSRYVEITAECSTVKYSAEKQISNNSRIITIRVYSHFKKGEIRFEKYIE